MKKYVVIGAIGLAAAVAGGGATYAVVGGETDEAVGETSGNRRGQGRRAAARPANPQRRAAETESSAATAR